MSDGMITLKAGRHGIQGRVFRSSVTILGVQLSWIPLGPR